MKPKLIPLVLLLCLTGHAMTQADELGDAFTAAGAIGSRLNIVDATLVLKTQRQLSLVTRVSQWKYRASFGAAPNLALANQCEQVLVVVHQSLASAAELSARSRSCIAAMGVQGELPLSVIMSLTMSAMQFADDSESLMATATTGMNWVQVQCEANGM